jgi:hypothetical protein
MKDIDKQIEEIERQMNDPDLCYGTASTYTLYTGYYRMVENFNTGKCREYLDRKEYRPFGPTGEADKRWVEKLLPGGR